jgi:hypothetical protein
VIALHVFVPVAVTVAGDVPAVGLLHLTTVSRGLRTRRVDVNAKVIIDGVHIGPLGNLSPVSHEIHPMLMFAFVISVGTGASPTNRVDAVGAAPVLADNRVHAALTVENAHDFGECAHLSIFQVL